MARKLFSLLLAVVLGWAGLNLSIHGNLTQGIIFLAAGIILVLPAFFGMEIGSVVDGTYLVSLVRNPAGTLFNSATQSFESWVDTREQLEGDELANVEAGVRSASLGYDAAKVTPDTSAFDPDAVIRNYLDNRPGGPPPPVATPAPAPPPVAAPAPTIRPTFGRKAI